MKGSSAVKAEKMFIAPFMWHSIPLQAMRQCIYVLLYQECTVSSGGAVECGSKPAALINNKKYEFIVIII